MRKMELGLMTPVVNMESCGVLLDFVFNLACKEKLKCKINEEHSFDKQFQEERQFAAATKAGDNYPAVVVDNKPPEKELWFMNPEEYWSQCDRAIPMEAAGDLDHLVTKVTWCGAW